MIVVRVELHSAITGRVTELARMEIANDGAGAATHGNYDGVTFKGRDAGALDRRVEARLGAVENFPRKSTHVWSLVARMLERMNYR